MDHIISSGAENALKHGVRGTFTWTSWTCDVALSASTVVLTMGAASFAAWGYTSHGFSLMVEAREGDSLNIWNLGCKLGTSLGVNFWGAVQ